MRTKSAKLCELYSLVAVVILSGQMLWGQDQNITKIVEQYGNSIVLIAALQDDGKTIALGSGFIVESSGVLVTNFHVINKGYPVLVKLVSGDIYDNLSVIDTDERRDIAILKMAGWNLPTVKLGNSDSINVGDSIVVIGNPEGLQNTVTNGIISAVRKTEKGFLLHQISAPISMGSSGSPVFNMKGEVIGIASSSIAEGQNLNFSIPINYVRGLISNVPKMSLSELVSSKPVTKAYGITESESLFKEINSALYNTYSAYDNFIFGSYITKKPHEIRFIQEQYQLSSYILYANENIQIAVNKFASLRSSDLELNKILDDYKTSVREISRGINIAIQGLRKFSYGIRHPDWDQYLEGEAKIIAHVNELAQLNRALYQKAVDMNSSFVTNTLPIVKMLSQARREDAHNIGILWGLSSSGVRIIYVFENTPAFYAKIEPGDMILREVNGQRFNSIIEFSKFIAEKKQGEEITLEVETKKGIMHKKLKIGGFVSKPPLDYEAKKHLASFIAKKEETHRAIVTHIDLLGRNIQIEIDDLAITIERRIFSDPLPKLGDIVTVWIKSEKQCVLYFQKDNKMERVEFWILRGL